jgi:hypothetical protein
LIVLVCCVSLIFLQILKCYIVRCHTLERKLRVLSYHPGRPILNILANTKISPTIATAGKPIINANLPAPPAMFGSNMANNVAINTPSASSIAKIITPNRIAKITNTIPQFPKVVKVMIAKTGMPIKLEGKE